jgi:conjugal transfer/entry exclusion protein
MKTILSALANAPKMIFNILKYLPVILVVAKALEMVKNSIESVQNSEDVSEN